MKISQKTKNVATHDLIMSFLDMYFKKIHNVS